MAASKVPAPDFMRRGDEPDGKYVTGSAAAEVPSTAALEETISATILRLAKEKFESRPWQEDDSDYESSDGEVSDTGTNETGDIESKYSRSRSRSRSISKPVKLENDTEQEGAGTRYDNEEPLKASHLRPTVTTDDDLSYHLLRPSARHIISKLDATLNLLHVYHDSTMHYLSDSADSDVSASSHLSRPSSREGSRPGVRRKRGRPRKDITQSASRASEPPSEVDDGPSKSAAQSPIGQSAQSSGLEKGGGKKMTKAGRPRKAYDRLPNESDREFAVRIARLQKRPIPVFMDIDSGADASRESAGEDVLDQSSKPKKAGALPLGTSRVKRVPGERWRYRVKLRDWRHVLGAAALAGVSPHVVDRAARRCADLFGQSMELHTLTEGQTGSEGQTKTSSPALSSLARLEAIHITSNNADFEVHLHSDFSVNYIYHFNSVSLACSSVIIHGGHCSEWSSGFQEVT